MIPTGGGRSLGPEEAQAGNMEEQARREMRRAHRRQEMLMREARRLQSAAVWREERERQGRHRARARAERIERIGQEKQDHAQARREHHMHAKVRMTKRSNRSPLAKALQRLPPNPGPPPPWHSVGPVADGHIVGDPHRQVPIQHF